MILRSGQIPQTHHAGLDAALATHASVCRLDQFPQPQAQLPSGLDAGAAAVPSSSTASGGTLPIQSSSVSTSVSGATQPQAVPAAGAVDMAALAATLAQDLDSSDSEEFD